MIRTADTSPGDLKRIPGLFRRWELTEVFEPHRNYQIEEAGAHADGTPLLAIYVSEPVSAGAAQAADDTEADQGGDLRSAIPAGLLPEEMIAALPLILEFWETEREEPILRPLFSAGGATIGELRTAIRELADGIEGERRSQEALSSLLDALVARGASAGTRVAEMLKIIAATDASARLPRRPCSPTPQQRKAR
jgi:hypothetical protein